MLFHLKSRLAWKDLDFIRGVILFLARQAGWKEVIDEEYQWDNELERQCYCW
jgi:hypothetical protein